MRISETPVPILTAAEMLAAERSAMAQGETVETLMERAGRAVAEAVWRFGGGRPALILCGPGNNGGDGYVAARYLAKRGVDVRVAAFGLPGTDASRAAREAWAGPVEALEDADDAPVLVDALFGTGLARPLGDTLVKNLARLTKRRPFTVAVDVPSGVGSDDGVNLGAVPAHLTLALGALKPAHVLQPAAALCGIVKVADIGVTAESKVSLLTRPHIQEPGPESHKYRRGLVGIIGGEMPGAGALSALAAIRIAGYVLVSGMDGMALPHAVVHRPCEAILEDRRVGALLVGPGLGRGPEARQRLDQILEKSCPIVLDADALMLLGSDDFPEMKRRMSPIVMTPHAGEFAALFGDLSGSKIDRACAAAKISGSVIVFKGPDTVIACPDGRARVAQSGPGWLATAGTGDVLAGIVAALLASGRTPYDSASAAVWLHAEAARLAGPALIADEIPFHIPAAVAACL
ncbi:MAG: NAD(P)H-hydrate dehydratase [Sphingomonadales bacterium]|nr:NAD(P)H-hydrate dehydratase [Sphingomonadales bacterium]